MAIMSCDLAGQVKGWRNTCLQVGLNPLSSFSNTELCSGQFFFYRPQGNVGLCAQQYFERQKRFFLGVDVSFEEQPEFVGVVSSVSTDGALTMSLDDRLWLEVSRAVNWKNGWRRSGQGAWYHTLIHYGRERKIANVVWGQDSCAGPNELLISEGAQGAQPLYLQPLEVTH